MSRDDELDELLRLVDEPLPMQGDREESLLDELLGDFGKGALAPERFSTVLDPDPAGSGDGDDTVLTPVEQIRGYALINRGFVEYRNIRYGVKAISVEDLEGHFVAHQVADNPLSAASYASAQILRTLAGFIPMQHFREKIQGTADTLLEGDDAVFLRPSHRQ